MAILGIALFNQRQYWKAHEALEEAWKAESGPVRYLYRGILQVGTVYLHIQRDNYVGALKMYSRCQRWLDPFPDHCRGINIAQLRTDLETVITEARYIGPNQLSSFNLALFRPIVITK